MTHNEKILRHMDKFGNITAAKAATHFGCWRLAARIGELRAQGHNIETEMVTNGRVRYARYRLVKGVTR